MTIQEKKEIMHSLHLKVDERIKQIKLANPLLEQNVFDKAKENIRKRHGLKKTLAAYAKKLAQLDTLKQQIQDDFVDIVAKVGYRNKDEVLSEAARYGEKTIELGRLQELERYVERAMENSLQVETDLVLQESVVGKELLMLREQKKQIDDAVWLATSTAKIYPLYQQVSAITKSPITPLLQSGVNANAA